MRFTRRTTTPTTLLTSSESEKVEETSVEGFSTMIAALDNSTASEIEESVEKSVVTGPPEISVEIATKKSLRVRNCGERIGDDVPFIATLVHTNPFDNTKKKRSLSKGILITENFVLATVSSIYHSESFWTVSSVRLGDFVTWNKYANRDKSHTLEIPVDEIFVHRKKDLAMIKLKETVTFTDIIRPACVSTIPPERLKRTFDGFNGFQLPLSDSYNFKELQSHLCKRSHNKAPADVTLEFAVVFRNALKRKITVS